MPIRTLPEDEITRVSDIVPVRAQTQEIIGNRVVYGNFLQSYESPSNFDYSVAFKEKSASQEKYYPKHNLKQNRNYQVQCLLSSELKIKRLSKPLPKP